MDNPPPAETPLTNPENLSKCLGPPLLIRATHKHKIFSLVERDGVTRSFHVANVDAKSLKPILLEQVKKDSQLFTDTAGQYRKIKNEFPKHEMVNHSIGEYARGNVHTNTVESYFGLLKRCLVGTYHHVSEAHLQRYVTEFDFRFSHRKASDTERAKAVHANIARDGRETPANPLSVPEPIPEGMLAL